MHNWFPLGLASGSSFCNRAEERTHLKHNICHGIHTLIASPRRFGKTSLAQQVMDELKLPTTTMEFTLVSDLETAEYIISTAIGKLILRIVPTHKKALTLVNKFFSQLNPKFTIDTHLGAKIEFTPGSRDPCLGIMELLQKVDETAKGIDKKIILFMDEFQQIAMLENHLTLEAAIRNAAQRMKNTSIIFSGSNRHLLQLMFDDKNRPLFHLCDRINLRRIPQSDYQKHLQKVATKRWETRPTAELLQKIFQLTGCHPYYMNVLCGRLYRLDHFPDKDTIQTTWDEYIGEESDRMGKEIGQLSHHQKKMLLLLSTEPFSKPSSRKVVEKLHISTANATKCCKMLLENDYSYQDTAGFYRITDPAIESYLKRQAYLLGL